MSSREYPEGYRTRKIKLFLLYWTCSPFVVSLFLTRIATCVILIELRQALVPYHDYHMCYPDRVETVPYSVPGLPHVFVCTTGRAGISAGSPIPRSPGDLFYNDGMPKTIESPWMARAVVRSTMVPVCFV